MKGGTKGWSSSERLVGAKLLDRALLGWAPFCRSRCGCDRTRLAELLLLEARREDGWLREGTEGEGEEG